MATRPSLFHAYDRSFDGQLGPLLLQWKNEGQSVEDIAFRLRSEHEITVSAATVYRWLEIAKGEKASA